MNGFCRENNFHFCPIRKIIFLTMGRCGVNLWKKFSTYRMAGPEREIILPMSDFIHKLQSQYPDLRKSERKIADYLQAHAHERLDLSITELARTLKVSETTISRFCRVVGYQGFQDLKLSMATALNNGDSFQNIPAEIHEDDPPAMISKKLSESLRKSIDQTQQELNMGEIEAVIDALAKAGRIYLYGIGGSGVIVSAAHHLFTKAGLESVAHTDGYMQTVSASMMKPESVAIGVSNTGMSKHVVDALAIASERGATTVGITGNRNSDLARTAQICLVTPLGALDAPLYGGSIDAKACQLYLVDLLYLGVLFKLGSSAKKNLKETARALRTYYNPVETEAKESRQKKKK